MDMYLCTISMQRLREIQPAVLRDAAPGRPDLSRDAMLLEPQTAIALARAGAETLARPIKNP